MICRACGTPAPLLFSKDGIPCHLCSACGSLSKPAPTDLPGHYAEYLPSATLSLPPVTRERYREILRGLDGFGERQARRLLDVGAGAGLFLEIAREEGWAAEGTELSARAAAAAGLRDLVVHVGDLADLEFTDGSFDAVVSLETLEHVPDPRAFLRRIRRVLKPGGGLFLTTPNYDSLSRRWLGREWLAVSRDHICLFTPRALRACLRDVGFGRVEVISRTILPNELARRFRRRPACRQGFKAAETAAIQESFARRPILRLAKDGANRFLGGTGLGDVLTARAVREERP